MSAFALWLLTSAAAAQSPEEASVGASVDALEARASELGQESEEGRREAFEALTTLSTAWIPAVRERATKMRRQRFEPEAPQQAVRKFRHGTGSRRADDMVDIAPGVLTELDSTRDRVTVAMAERVALMRAMERLGGREAGRALMDLLALNPDAFRWERRRLLDRQGLALLPTLLDARSHPSPDIRRWARVAIPAIHGSDAGRVVRTLAHQTAVLADTLVAWADARDFDAMPVVVTFVDSDEARVREAARSAMRSYGQNGIWMLRRQFRSSVGEDAPREWGWRRTFDELVRRLDEGRLAPARAALAAGLAASEAGDLDEMRRQFDIAVQRAPLLPERAEMTPGYARWAEASLRAGRFSAARAAFLRAARLGDDTTGGEDLRARALLAEAEAEREAGVLDLGAYRLVTRLSPGQALATQRIAEQQTIQAPRVGPREICLLAGACLAILGLLMLFGNELPAVALAKKAALAGARMATSAGRSLRARAGRSLNGRPVADETARVRSASWLHSIPLALMNPKMQSPKLQGLAIHDTAAGLEPADPCSTAPGMDAPGDVYSTAAGVQAPSDVRSTECADEIVPGPKVGPRIAPRRGCRPQGDEDREIAPLFPVLGNAADGPAPQARRREHFWTGHELDVCSTAPGINAPEAEADAVAVAEALGILQPEPKDLDPFDDSSSFGDPDASFAGADSLFD